MQQKKIIGIDLGTTNSCVSVIEGGKPVVIPNLEGGRTTPSVVAFDKSLARLIGQPAKRQSIQNPDRTIQSIKRHMGTNKRVHIDHMEFSPEQISASILQKIKVQAQTYLGERVSQAIITVPAYFDDAQRLATRHAGEIAGLEVVRIINEPTACALAYGFNKLEEDTNVVIFDFGGGTFDVTILHIEEGVLQVKSTNGNNRLGGDDFDERIIKWLLDTCQKQHNIDISSDPVAMQRLKESAEKAKIELSGMSSTIIQLPFLAYAEGQPVHLELELFQKEFNELTSDLVQAVAAPIEAALRDAKMSAEDVQKVVLAGGTTRIPSVQQFIRRYFNREPVKSVNPDEAVAIGAAIQGGILAGEVQEVLLLDVLPLTLGMEGVQGEFIRIVPRNSTIPLNRAYSFSTNKNNQTSLTVHILQGEDDLAKNNISLATFDISGIPEGAAGEQQVTLTFDIDADGIIHCKATHAGGVNNEVVVLKRSSGYNQNELEGLKVVEHEMVEREEAMISRLASKVLAEESLSEAERFLNKMTEKLSEEQIKSVQNAATRLRGVLETAESTHLEALRKQLNVMIERCGVVQTG